MHMLKYDILDFDDNKLSMEEGNRIISQIINIFREREMSLEAAKIIMKETNEELHKIAVIK